MKKNTKSGSKVFLMAGIVSLILCTNSQVVRSQSDSSKESTYQEVYKDGRLYVFASSDRKADFEKSGELGVGIIKIGYGSDGKTVIFDSEDAIIEYESRQIKELLKKVNITGYKECKKDGRLYVFISPTRMASFEKSGELGPGIIKIGYGVNGETVVFDSDEAVKEYNNRHPLKQTQN